MPPPRRDNIIIRGETLSNDLEGLGPNRSRPLPGRRCRAPGEQATTGTLNISLPDTLRDFVDGQVAQGSYGTSSEYLISEIPQQAHLVSL